MIALLLGLALLADVDLPRTLGAPPPVAAPRKPQEEPPKYRLVGDERTMSKPAPADQWNYYAWAPIETERNNVWHGLLNTPPLEEAAVMPAGTWHARATMDFATADWTADEGVVESKFHGAYLTQTLALDYNWSTRFQVGVRLTAGQLGEGDDENIQVVDGAQQIVENGDRAFGLAAAVARARMVFPTRYAGTFGVRAEVKAPLSDEEDMLSSQTVDVGLTALYSKRWEKISFHANLGVVVPTGDLGVFIQDDEASPYVHGGMTLSWPIRPHFVMLGQIEFNSSAFGDIGPIDEPVACALAGARYKLGGRMYLSASLGHGLTDASGGIQLNGGIDVVF